MKLKNVKFKTTIGMIAMATVVWAQAKWFIDNADAIYLSSILTWLGISVNLYTNYGTKK